MAHAIMLQDWITVTGNGNVVIQNEDDWAEVPSFQDGSFYVEVGNCTAAPGTPVNVDIQSAPTKDEVFFAAAIASGNPYLARFALSTSTTGVQNIQVVRWATGTNQLLARFARWKATFPASGPWNVTFRIWLNLNQAGWR